MRTSFILGSVGLVAVLGLAGCAADNEAEGGDVANVPHSAPGQTVGAPQEDVPRTAKSDTSYPSVGGGAAGFTCRQGAFCDAFDSNGFADIWNGSFTTGDGTIEQLSDSASLGSGSTSHLTMEMFRSTAGVRLNHVPFKGSADAHTQLIGGQVPVMFDAIPATRPHIQGGKLRGLGIATTTRSSFLPDLPTIAEAGYPGFEAVGWIGIAAPAKTPAAILDKLNAEMVKIINAPDVKERLSTLAFTPVGDSRAQFAAYIKSEIAKWGNAVKESGAKAD